MGFDVERKRERACRRAWPPRTT